MKVTETKEYWRVSFWDGAQMDEYKTVRIDSAYAVTARDPSSGRLYIQSILLPKKLFSVHDARIKAFYYKGLFIAKE